MQMSMPYRDWVSTNYIDQSYIQSREYTPIRYYYMCAIFQPQNVEYAYGSSGPP